MARPVSTIDLTPEKFKEANEAYEVLSDREKRRRYDALGTNWKAGSDFTPPPGWERTRVEFGDLGSIFGGDGGAGFSDFFESLFGGRRASGRGAAGRRASAFRARGSDVEGEISIPLQEAHRGGTRSISLQTMESCPECSGTGSRTGGHVRAVMAPVAIRQLKSLDVNIPVGVRDGVLIRLPGQGEPGAGGAPLATSYCGSAWSRIR